MLEPLSGYLLLAKKMWESPMEYCEGWNFGPEPEAVSTVWEVATELAACFGGGELVDMSDPQAFHEAQLLRLDITKAKTRLGWHPALNSKQAVALAADWYKQYRFEDVYRLCTKEIERYLEEAAL